MNTKKDNQVVRLNGQKNMRESLGAGIYSKRTSGARVNTKENA